MKMSKCIPSLALIAISFSLCLSIVLSNPVEQPNQASGSSLLDFGSFVERFHKNYGVTDSLNRAKLFVARTLNIFKHNVMYKDNKKTYYLQQNQYIDLTKDELLKNYVNPDLVDVDKSKNNQEEISHAALNDLVMGDSNKKVAILDFTSDQPTEEFNGVVEELRDRPDIAKMMDSIVNIGAGKSNTESDNWDQEEISQGTLFDMKGDNKEDATLDFMLDQTIDDFSGVVRDLRERPNVAKKMDKIVNIGVKSESNAQKSGNRFGANFANLMMDDLGMNIEPYASYDDEVNWFRKKKPKTQESSLMKFLSSVKSMMSNDDLIDNWSDDDTDEKKDTAKQNDQQPEPQKPKPQTGIKYRVDWRVTNCISAPKSQLDCNSCYAFATLYLLEFFYCRQKKEPIEFSPQYIVNCGKKTGLNGCQGGKLSSMGKFLMDYGVKLESNQPYSAREDVCPYKDDSDKENDSGLLRPKVQHWKTLLEHEEWDKWLRRSPLIVGINMPSDFLAYGGGLHDGDCCVPEMAHAMLLIGNGVEDGHPFWLFKNTLSENWGEKGYFRLSKRAPKQCFNAAVVTRVDF